jgi:hypothetical protein
MTKTRNSLSGPGLPLLGPFLGKAKPAGVNLAGGRDHGNENNRLTLTAHEPHAPNRHYRWLHDRLRRRRGRKLAGSRAVLNQVKFCRKPDRRRG